MSNSDVEHYESEQLRRTIRDLVALTTLPATWQGFGYEGIARTLGDAMLNTLSLDLIYVRFDGPTGKDPVEVLRTRQSLDESLESAIKAYLTPFLNSDRREHTETITAEGLGTLRAVVIQFGIGVEHGVLIGASRYTAFPTMEERLLLGVGANQAAIAVQRLHSVTQVHEQREWLRVTLASIGDAVIATDSRGQVTFLNSVAEELTGWSMEDAEGKPLETVFVILNQDTRQRVENPVEKVLREGSVVGLANHTILIATDGTERPIDDSAAPIRNARGELVGVVMIFRDVTEQRKAEREVRASEALKSAILEAALDCVITMDHQGMVVDFNPAAERTFGYSRGDVIGRELAELIIPPSLRERHRQGMAHYLATGEGPVLGKRVELPAMHADGSEFPVELAITRIPTDGPPLFTAYLRDIGERTRAEQYRNARLGVTQALNQAADVREGASGVLRAVCESLCWDVGFFWIVKKGGDCLECLESWHKPELPVTEFEVVTFSREFKKGEGLPGHVWSTGKPRWLIDVVQDANFPRAASAANYDLHSAFACPVVVGARVIGVMEFFTRRIREPDAGLLEMMGTVAGNVGQFIERRSAEQELTQSEAELADFFENATVGLHLVGADGIILRANRAELDMLGYSRDEYVGRPIAGFHVDEDVIFDILNRLQAGEKLSECPARLRCKDGSIKDVLIDSSVLWNNGKFVHTRCFTRDITERTKAEVALRESEEKLRLLADTIPQLAWMARPDGHIFWYNRRWFDYTGKSASEMEGWGWQSVHHPDVLPEVLERWKKSIDSGEPFDMVFPLKGADGHFRPFLTRVNPLINEGGQILYWFGTNTDISEQNRAEEELRYRHKLLRAITDTATTAIFMMDEQSRCTFMNPAAEQMTGYSFREVEGQILHDLIHHTRPDGSPYPVSECPIDRALPGGFIVNNHEDLFVRKDCSLFPVLCNARPVVRENVEVGTVIEVRDITLQKQAEAALRESEERLRLALDAGRMGVWDWNIRTGELNWSDSLEPLHGLAPGTFGGTFDHFQQLIHPEDRDTVNFAIREALETGNEFYVEFRNASQNGGIRWIAGSGKVFPGDDGQPLRMIGIGMDVTQRKRTELTSRFLADASAALAVLVDFDSTLQKVSSLAVPAFADWATVDLAEADGSLRRVSVSHIDPAKVQLAHEIHRRFPPDPGAPQGVWEILRTGRAEIVPEITDELLVQSANDAEMLRILRELGLKSYIGVPLTIRGKTMGVITFINAESGHRYDNTDLAVAEDLASRAAIAVENAQLYRELRETDRRKDEFLATLAHELRNPLAPIHNGLQIIRLSGDNVAAVGQTRSMMERQLSQMVHLVDDLLDVSRISRGKLELRKEPVDLAVVVNCAVETSRPVVEASGQELTIDMPPTPVVVDADVTRLGQVFSNLLNNAAKYSAPGGQIQLTANTLGGEVVVSVKDTGIGIPSAMLPTVFDLFTQVDRSLEKSQGGLGIGLTLVKRLVEMHGGSVTAHSEGSGRGSTFTVRLPVLVGKSQAHRPSEEEDAAPKTCLRILVVDDNRDAAESLGIMLTLMGNEVRTAADGLAAVETAGEYLPDVILLDIGLPKLNGYDACRRIREQEGSKEIMIVALTGWGQEEDRRRSVNAGFDHHLIKPVDFDDLIKLLQQAMR